MELKRLLVVLPGLPWPARNDGICVRYHPVLSALAERHVIDVIAYDEERQVIPDDPLRKKLRNVQRFSFRKDPVSLLRKIATRLRILWPWNSAADCSTYAYTPRAQAAIEALIELNAYDAIIWSGKHQEALPAIRRQFSGRIVFDMIDSVYLNKQRAYKIPTLAQRLELSKLKRLERELVGMVDQVVYIAKPDAVAAFDGDLHCAIIPNSVIDDDFVELSIAADRNMIGFLGNMAYKPNVQAALRLHQRVFIPLKKQFPNLKLKIIGRDPVASIQALASDDVIVTGTVDNIWDHVAAVGTFVFPMSTGSGLQNKLIEVMYAGKPAVTTEICRASLGAVNSRDLLVGDSDAELIAQTARAIKDDPLRILLSRKGREYVNRTFAIDAIVNAFERTVLVPPANH